MQVENISVQSCPGEEPSVIAGYSEEFFVRDVTIRNMFRDGKRVHSLEEANIQAGSFAKNIRIE